MKHKHIKLPNNEEQIKQERTVRPQLYLYSFGWVSKPRNKSAMRSVNEAFVSGEAQISQCLFGIYCNSSYGTPI